MLVHSDINLSEFKAWSGGRDTIKALSYEQMDSLTNVLEELYPDGMTDGELNDLLWFERDWIAEMLGFRDWEQLEYGDEDEDEDEDEEDEEDEEDLTPDEVRNILAIPDDACGYRERDILEHLARGEFGHDGSHFLCTLYHEDGMHFCVWSLTDKRFIG